MPWIICFKTFLKTEQKLKPLHRLLEKERPSNGNGDSCLDSGEMGQLEMVRESLPTVKSGLLEGERRAGERFGTHFNKTPNDRGLASLGVSRG